MRFRGPLPSIRSGAALTCVGALTLAAAGTAVGQQAKTLPVFENGEAQVVPGFSDKTQWIQQSLWVETGFDSDNDGKPDRIHVDVTRPRQTETEGLKVPVIYEASPYYTMYHGGKPSETFWNIQQDVDAAPQPRVSPPVPSTAAPYSMISPSHVAAWVPRGFAVVHSESPGTGQSQGCPTVGGENEALGAKAVIDWLNGRARAFTTRDGNEPVVASWSTGKVGMIGVSYDGTLTIAAATTGVDGLKAIVPVSPVSSWYEYYRSNGLVRSPGGYLGEDMDVLFDFVNTGAQYAHCAATIRDSVLTAHLDRATGDYTPFWAGRDYLAKVDNIKAAVLDAHGLNDWNTMPNQSVRLYEALKKRHVPAEVYLSQDGHGAVPPLPMLNRWFTRYLYDVQNGVDTGPRAWIVPEKGSTPTPYADYPNPAATNVTLHLRKGGAGIGALGITSQGGQGKETLTDDVALSPGALARLAQDTHRLLYATPVLTDSVHLSGWTSITVRLAASKPAANLSVYLVALPTTHDSAAKVKLVTRGWADPQNYKSVTHGEPLVPGQFYTVHFNLQPEDRMIPAGTQLALMILSSDRGFTLRPPAGTQLTVDLDATSVVLPIVGGAAALDRALGQTRP